MSERDDVAQAAAERFQKIFESLFPPPFFEGPGWEDKSPRPVCMGCFKSPDQLACYTGLAEEMGISPDDYVRQEEGTYNRNNGHFLCDDCYVAAGMPTEPGGWTCP